MPRTNGGIIGKRNVASFGKCKQTTITSSGTHTTNPGTRIVHALLVAGGGGGASDNGGGGGGGGYLCSPSITVPGPFSVTVGGGGAGEPGPANTGGTSGNIL